MEWIKDLQPLATVIAAIFSFIAVLISTITLLRLQDKKRNDDIDLKSFENALIKQTEKFKQTLVENNSYLAERGKNLATKEDIEEITKQVESVKNEFVIQNRVFDHQLSKKEVLHKLQAEKEFQVYSDLWQIIANLKIAFFEHRPLFDPQPEGIDRKELWKNREIQFKEIRNQLMKKIEEISLFIPENVNQELRQINLIAVSEITDFDMSFNYKGEMTSEGKSKGDKNLVEFLEKLNNAQDLIRTRLTQ